MCEAILDLIVLSTASERFPGTADHMQHRVSIEIENARTFNSGICVAILKILVNI
jgi:hypothetical protein